MTIQPGWCSPFMALSVVLANDSVGLLIVFFPKSFDFDSGVQFEAVLLKRHTVSLKHRSFDRMCRIRFSRDTKTLPFV
jgi:hypothetical protein